jgi:hypothetical protein
VGDALQLGRRVDPEPVVDRRRLSTFRPVRQRVFDEPLDVAERVAVEAKCSIREILPAPVLEDRHEAIAVDRLHDEGASRPKNPLELRDSVHIALLPVETERGEQVDGAEARSSRR